MFQFADTAEDRGYIADSQMDRYLADFFGTSEDSQSVSQKNECVYMVRML